MIVTTPLAPFQRILLGADGTVTHILEAYADEPIEAVKLSQELEATEDVDARIEASEGMPVLRRRVLLRSRHSQRNLLYAEAVVVTERVSLTLVEGLIGTNLPIGTLLARDRTETFREILHVGRERAGPCAAHFGIDAGADVLTRTYRILGGGHPIMLITERFPAGYFLGRPA